MAINKSVNSPKKGMNRDKAKFDLTNVEYSFAMNANFQDEHGSGQVNIQNEPSNILCSGFKDGYKVIGHKFDINSERTYFFLTNPDTGCSEIGYIDSFYNINGLDQVTKSCDCNIKVILENPLEGQDQVATCNYYTLLDDYCPDTDSCGCLGFDIDYPIYESNIQIKDEKLGKTIYWTDNLNPQRHLKLDYLADYKIDRDPCTGDESPVCLKCDELRVFQLFEKPCLNVEVLQNGGNLKAGTYEMLIAYSTQTGTEISDYYALTNPVPVFDVNNNILDQTNLDYLTNQSIKLKVTGADSSYDYYKIAVVYRSGLDGAVVVKENGVYPIDNESVSISTLVDKESMDLSDVLKISPKYTKARGLTQGNGYLFQYGMESQREINLQPIVNLLGGFVNWSTVMADEDLYKDGANVSNYTGFMRDEVVPLSIRFYIEGGYVTPNFTFIPRPPYDSEVEVLGSGFTADRNTDSILDPTAGTCITNNRDKRWQFENTATDIGECFVPVEESANSVVVQEDVISNCIVEDVNGDVEIVGEDVGPNTVPAEGFTSIVDYINQNTVDVLSFTDPIWLNIQNILSDTYPTLECSPSFGDNCAAPILESVEIIALSADSEEVIEKSIPYDEYDRVQRPSEEICNSNVIDTGAGGPIQDSSFETLYMRAGETVYQRANPMSNITCVDATTPMSFPNPASPAPYPDNAFHLIYEGALSSNTSLQQTIDVSLVTNEFTDKLHTNAIWYEIPFNGLDTMVVELSYNTCQYPDDISSDKVRVTAYLDCNATSDIASYASIINDISLQNDPDKFIELYATDFGGPNGTAYIAIDTPLHSEADWTIDLSGSAADGDTFDITIDSTVYTVTFNTDIATTLTDFVTTNQAAFLSTHNIILDENSTSLTLRSLEEQYTNSVIDNQVGDLEGTATLVETYHTLRPPCGCTNIYTRVPDTEPQIKYTGLKFGKKMTWKATCDFTRPVLDGCDPVPHRYGEFGYWESEELYPCNDELFDSSGLLVDMSKIPGVSSKFQDYYCDPTTPVINGYANLDLSKTDFREKPIRHYKFPCSIVSPFMNTEMGKPSAFGKSTIYPIGFSISNDTINAFLDVALENGLITLEERSNIVKYEIFRGDRSVDKSIISKGLLFDMYQYQDNGTVYYPNYPLNALGKDQFNGNTDHPYGSHYNKQWTFHSPDIHFYKPTLPREMKVEGYVRGSSAAYFDEVQDHPTYVLLGDKAFKLATGLATTEVTLQMVGDILAAYLEASAAGTVYGIVLAIVVAVAVTAILIAGMFKIGRLRYEWLETFRNLGHPHNFAYYSATLGHYSWFKPNDLPGDRLRRLPAISYMKDGRWNIPNEVTGSSFNVNNMDREDSVFLTVGASHQINYPTDYKTFDNVSISEGSSSRKRYSGTGGSGAINGRVASPYVSLKQYLPSQYGSITSLNWIHTGFCGDLRDVGLGCNPIFGGDTYISRFSVKRKLPFFTGNSHGLAPLTPFKYSDYFNINPNVSSGRFFIDYLIQDDSDNKVWMFVFPTNRSKYQLDAHGGDKKFYIKPPSKFYLFSYGFPYFLVESTINCNFRYAKREPFENFYPNVGNLIEFTQESNISIRQPNTYFYNFVYTSLPTIYPWRQLPIDYNAEEYSKLSDLSNTVIYSAQDQTENSLTDPWLIYKGLDSYNFPKSFGRLIDMDSIESEQILARFENGITIFGAIDQIRDRVTPATKNIGSGGIFAGRSVNFNKTDLGYAGTQHRAKVSCEFGHFWVDAKRGQVFNLAPNAKGLNEITTGLEKWFKEHLPFKIQQHIGNIDNDVLDNAFKGLGITMGWDARMKRVFLTKLDYIPLDDTTEVINSEFYITDENRDKVKVELTDTNYFEDCSFTVAYSPLTQSWVSYYSFKPNYYIAYNNYFQTGKNYSVDASEVGLWSHLPFLSSYQVFYGKLYPFIIESTTPSKMTDSMLHSVEYWMDVRKYYNKYNQSDIVGHGFNKAFVYNSQNNSGQLNLVPQKNGDLSQNINYPKFNSDSIDILQSEIGGKWSFNYLYNAVRNENSGLPVWLYDCNQIGQDLNNPLLDYKNFYKDRLRGDYFVVRLQQDIESRFKMTYRAMMDNRDFYEN